VDDRAALVEREARERVLRVETKNTVVLAYAREETNGLIWKVTLLEGELAEARWAREVAKENFRDLSNVATDGAWRLVVTEWEHREQFEELTLLQTWGSELCLAIVGPARVRGCGPLPFAAPKWLESLPRFERWCPLPWSRC
jgi:hypothetical protein